MAELAPSICSEPCPLQGQILANLLFMLNFICETCGIQYALGSVAGQPFVSCFVCEDERQYVGWNGQRWTMHDSLATMHSVQIGTDAGLSVFAMIGGFAIPQRMLLLFIEVGNLLWESLSFVTD